MRRGQNDEDDSSHCDSTCLWKWCRNEIRRIIMQTRKGSLHIQHTTRWRCSYKRLLIPFLVPLLGVWVWANLIFVIHFPVDQQSTDISMDSQNKPDKSPLVEILRLAKVNLTQDEWESLPSWQQVLDRVGNKPRIIGLETCKTYRDTVPLKQRFVAPSGMFSTGTNLLHELLNKNCVVHRGGQHSHIGWQVNWGKHQSPRFRHANHVVEDLNNSNTFPIVMVRDPWTWLQSMCRVRYSAHWFHGRFKTTFFASETNSSRYDTKQPTHQQISLSDQYSYTTVADHCPNLIPNHVEQEWYFKSKKIVTTYFDNDPWLVDNVMDKANFTLESKVVPVRVRYKNEVAFHDSIAHFWKEWNQEYYDAFDGTAIFPRLMIRLEDLVFYPQHILTTICNCVGGRLLSPLILKGDTSKRGGENVHGRNKTDLRTAMISHVYTNRTKGMTFKDIHYASSVLKESKVLQAMGYPWNPL